MDTSGANSCDDLFTGPYRGLLCAMHEAIVMIDEGQHIVALNPAAEELLRCPAREALGTSLARFIPPAWRDGHAAQVRAFASSRELQRSMEKGRRVSLQRADGTTGTVQVALSRVDLADPAGGAARVVYAAILHDESQASVLEARLAGLERRMRAVFELSPTAIWICENDRLVFANRATARLFGTPGVEPLIGQPVWELLDAGSHETLRQEIERSLAGQTVGAVVSGRLRHADGLPREVDIALAALPDHGARTVQMVVSDVTDRRREAAELERSRRALRELAANGVEAREEERRRIARELHDELGQRLTALKLELAHLSTQVGIADDDARLSAMQSMLDDTLASLRRIASDLRPLMLDDLGLNAAIEWLARDASQRMGFEVRTRLPLEEPAPEARVATALYRMVQEALTNVARHARAHAVQISLGAHDSALGRELELVVTDDGIGIDDGALQRGGSFGLLGMRERALALGGRIEVGPAAGGGTTLRVRLPAKLGALAPSPRPPQPQVPGRPRRGGRPQ